MLVFRRYLAVGAGVIFVLGYKLSANAQKPTLVNSQNSIPAPVQETLPQSSSLLTAARILLVRSANASDSKSAEQNTLKDKIVVNWDDRNDLDAWRYAEPLVSQMKQMDSEDAAPEVEPPSVPSEEFDLAPDYEKTPIPARLNPSDNPLRYPTRPNEVEIETLQPITLGQAIELALRNNREFQITRLELERANEVLREALAAQYPNLDLSVDVTRADSARSRLGTGTTFGGITGTPGTGTNGANTPTTPGTGTNSADTPTTPGSADGLGVADEVAPTPGAQSPLTPNEIEPVPLSQEVDEGTVDGEGEVAGDGADVGADGDVTTGGATDLSGLNLGNDTDTTSNFLDGSIQLSYNIYTGGLRPAQIRAAERQVRFSELQVEVIAEETRLAVANDYYDLQNADAQVNIERAAVEDATQTLRDAQLLEQAGLGTRFDVLQAEVELANANQALTLATANQRIASRQLAETLSIGPNVGLTTADEIEEAGEWNLSLEESIVLAFQNRAELEQFLLQREIDRQQREIALAAIRPQLSVFAAYNLVEDLGDADTGFEDGYSVGASIQWRLYDGGAARARAEQSETDTNIDELQFANQRNQVRLQVEDAFFSLDANRENIRTSEQAVDLAEESLRLARLRFQAGVGTQTEVIDAQTALTEARGNFLTAIIDFNRSLNQLQRAVSNLPDNRLFDIP